MILQKNIFNIKSAFSLSKKLSSVSFSAGNITSNASENKRSNMVTFGKIKVLASHYMLFFSKENTTEYHYGSSVVLHKSMSLYTFFTYYQILGPITPSPRVISSSKMST